MKKIITMLVLVLCLAFGGLFACATPANNEPEGPAVVEYTVAFEVDGARFATKKVAEGGTISGTVANPSKAGFNFDGWTLNGEIVADIYAYVVNANVTFIAQFTEIPQEPEEPEDDTNYFNVYIQVNGTYLTQDEANTFKTRFFETIGVSEAEVIRFHIEEGDAATFKALIQGATDVDLVIGGNSPLKDFDYNAEYYNTESSALMNVASGHFASTNRKIIIMADCNNMELAVRLYTFATTPYVVNNINVTVIVHGDTTETTVLTDSDTVVTMPEITVPEGMVFKGFATVENGAPTVVVAKDAVLKYDNIKVYLPENVTELNLYPCFEDKPVVRAHYVKIAWYDNSASGLNTTIIAEIKTALEEYLTAQGVSAEEIATIDFKAYSGKVEPATTAINADGDVDIMIGFGSAENITTTGKIDPDSIVETIGGFTMGEKTRFVHVISSAESVEKTMEFIRTADLDNFKAPVPAE